MRLPDTSYKNTTSLRKVNPNNSFSSGSNHSNNHSSSHSSVSDNSGASDTGEQPQRYRYDKEGKRVTYNTQRQDQASEKQEEQSCTTKINHSIEEKKNMSLPNTSYKNTTSLRKPNPNKSSSSSSSSQKNSSSLSNLSSASDTGEQRYRYDKGGKRLTYTQRQELEKQEETDPKMFDLFDRKVSIEILQSEEDDNLAASIYGDAKIGKKSSSKALQKTNRDDSERFNESISGYDFDSLMGKESSSTGLPRMNIGMAVKDQTEVSVGMISIR